MKAVDAEAARAASAGEAADAPAGRASPEGGEGRTDAGHPPSRLRPAAADWPALVPVSLAAYLVFRWSLGAVRPAPGTPSWLLVVASVPIAFAAIGLPAAILAGLARRVGAPLRALGTAALGLAVWGASAAATRAVPAAPLPVRELFEALADAGKIVAAGGVGIVLARFLREPNMLLPAGLFAAFADFVVVRFGTVHHALQSERGRALVHAVSARVPAVHPSLEVTVGPGDFLFLGILLACAARFGMDLRRNLAALTVALGLTLLAVPLLGPVPALAPMAITFVALNRRHFRLSREECVASVVVLTLIGALFLGFFLLVGPRR